MMKTRIAVFAIIGAAAAALSYLPVSAFQDTTTTAPPTTTTAPPAATSASGPKTTWDGVYSQAQAAKGDMVYSDKCLKCHGANGGGADAPPLVGADFASDWDGLS